MTEVGERVNDTRGQEEYLDNGTILYVDCGTDYTTIFFVKIQRTVHQKGENRELCKLCPHK